MKEVLSLMVIWGWEMGPLNNRENGGGGKVHFFAWDIVVMEEKIENVASSDN